MKLISRIAQSVALILGMPLVYLFSAVSLGVASLVALIDGLRKVWTAP